MIRLLANCRIRWLLGGTALLTAACVQFWPTGWPRTAPLEPGQAPAVVMPTVASVAPTAAAARVNLGGRETAVVRRGPIAEQLPLEGRVGGLEEVPLTLPVLARVESVLVRQGDRVEEGQVLLETEPKDGAKALNAARSRLEASTARLEQLEGEAEARRREVERRLETERTRWQNAIKEAQAALRRAEADQQRVRAGPSRAERLEREAAVVAARAALQRAEADLARLSAGPSEAETKAAEQQLNVARLALQRAEVEHQRVTRGPDPAQVRAAQRDVATAQTALDRAQADLDRLARGPDPMVVAAAEREVQRAELALRAARASKADKDTRAAREAAIASAELGLRDAQDRLTRARQGAPPWEIEVARRNVEVARVDLNTAHERLADVLKGPDQLTIDAARLELQRARAQLEEAEARAQAPRPGIEAERAAAADAVSNAQATLAVATARLAELNSRPTPAELAEAEERVAMARAALEQAQAQPEPVADADVDPTAAELIVLRKAVEQDHAEVEALERDLAANRLLAPFAGVVAAIQVRAGETAEPGRPVLILARPENPVVRAAIADADGARLAPGQSTSIQLEGTEGPAIGGTVREVQDAKDGLGPSVVIDVAWPATPPAIGRAARAIVTLQHKDGVLLAPAKAIRSSGGRRYVEYLEDGNRRLADVEVGVVTPGDVEIVRGLAEGQTLLVGP